MVNYMSIKVKTTTIKELLKYHKPEEIFGHCKRCPKYGQFWSCPPYDFNLMEHINKFSFASIIAVRIYLSSRVHEEAINEFFEKREKLSNSLMEIESQKNGSEILYGGNCTYCKVCSRTNGESCIAPKMKRFSLESLGFKVSEILESLMKEKLQWSKGSSTPEYLMSVYAIFSSNEISSVYIKDFIMDTFTNVIDDIAVTLS